MLNSPHNRSAAHRVIAAHLDAAGIAHPAGVARAIAVDSQLGDITTTDALAGLRSGITGTASPAKLRGLALTAATDLLAQERAAQVHAAVQPDLDQLARRALAADADRVLADLRPIFDDAVAGVTEMVQMFGTLTPPSDIRTAPGLVDLVQRSTDAQERLRAILAVRRDLAELGYGPSDESPSWYVTSVADLDTEHRRCVDIIAAGVAVRLNTAEQIRELTAARDAEAERRAVARAEAKARAADADPMVRSLRQYRESIRTGPPDAA